MYQTFSQAGQQRDIMRHDPEAPPPSTVMEGVLKRAQSLNHGLYEGIERLEGLQRRVFGAEPTEAMLGTNSPAPDGTANALRYEQDATEALINRLFTVINALDKFA